MAHYPNVTLFHGHSHLEFALQEHEATANYDSKDGYHSVHVPSITIPRTGNAEGASSKRELPDKSEGYQVDVYENGIMLRGRDFVTDRYLPIAQYYLDTTLKKATNDVITDDTCTIHWGSEGIPLEWERGLKTQKGDQPQIEAPGYASSQRIEIEEGYRYRLCCKNAYAMAATVYYYDAEGKYISHTNLWEIDMESGTQQHQVKELKLPKGATSFILRLGYSSNATQRKVADIISYMSLTKWQG